MARIWLNVSKKFAIAKFFVREIIQKKAPTAGILAGLIEKISSEKLFSCSITPKVPAHIRQNNPSGYWFRQFSYLVISFVYGRQI